MCVWGGTWEVLFLKRSWGHLVGLANALLSSWQISSVLQAERPDSYLQHFLSLQHSFLCCAFAIVLGGGFFLLTALHLEKDQARARQPGKGTSTPCSQAPGWTHLDWEHRRLPLDGPFQSACYAPVVCQAR